MDTIRLTTAQALVRFLANQYVERDGVEQRLFAGAFGIFGHGNVAGVGQALQQYGDELTYYQPRNEQAMVHTAAAYARQKNRLQTLACTSSIGPGATNMVTGRRSPPLTACRFSCCPATSSPRARRTRSCSSWRRRTTAPSRSTTASGPSRSTGTA